MNIEVLSRLIEAADVSVFRSLTVILMPLIGLGDADYCDGPYDGGKDFTLAKMSATGIKIGIQVSIEKKWENKIKSDAIKLQNKYNVNYMYFLSSRRIPEGTYEGIKNEIFSNYGITVIKYDCQAIATKLINGNKVSNALALMGMKNDTIPEEHKKYLGPKNEAIS